MEFEEWSNKKKEQEAFSRYAAEKRNTAQPIAASYSAPFVGVGESTRTGIERTQPTQPIKSQPEIKTTPAPRRGGITLHPGMEEVDQKAKESAAAKEISPERERQPQTKAPYILPGQANKLGIEPTPPTKPFTFSQSPKAEIPANRLSAFDTTLLPGERADRCLTAEEGRRANGERSDRRLWRMKGTERVAATWNFGLNVVKEQNALVAIGTQLRDFGGSAVDRSKSLSCNRTAGSHRNAVAHPAICGHLQR
jgi:hypothetical protein